MKKIKIEKLKNLKKVIEELNSPKTFTWDDGTIDTYESPFEFVIKQRNDLYDGAIAVYDVNEFYSIDYEEELSSLCGHYVSDDILPQLEDALKRDLGPNVYLEHYDSVIMTIAF